MTIRLLTLIPISLTACSNEPTSPSGLLLGPEDFPLESISELGQEPGTTNKDKPVVQVKLRATRLTILESLVLFKTKELALAILADIKPDQDLLGIISTSVDGSENSSGILVERLDGKEASTVFFVDGRALVKITVSGEKRTASILKIDSRAREKAKG